jgi:photosystem II stability/assembly factor-like uncharacterized protein
MYKKTLLVLLFLVGGHGASLAQLPSITTIDTILKAKISIRAILLDGKKLWYAGDQNQLGFYNLKTKQCKEIQIQSDTLKLQFRSIAQNKSSIFVANIGNPAFIFKIDKTTLQVDKVYDEYHEKVFYDSLNFWNEQEGIALGDPITDCLSILITRDGGNTWIKMNCTNLPSVAQGEAAFAASNTNICVYKDKTWIVTGGTKSRVYHSDNKGTSWKVTETPVIQGQSMTGIYTADFFNDQIGFIAGGNYDAPLSNSQNKALTLDGGKSWNLIADKKGFGYSSCLQFVPSTHGNNLVSVGATGIYYSSDQGRSWNQICTDPTLYTIRFLNKNIAFAAGKNKIVQINFN